MQPGETYPHPRKMEKRNTSEALITALQEDHQPGNWARRLARIGRRPAEPVVRGSNPRGPAIHLACPALFLLQSKTLSIAQLGDEPNPVLEEARVKAPNLKPV